MRRRECSRRAALRQTRDSPPPKDLDGSFPFEVPQTKARLGAAGGSPQAADPGRDRHLADARADALTLRSSAARNAPTSRSTRSPSRASPGHFVTGLLFRPKGKSGRLPAVLSPHGHEGRLWDYGEKGVRQMIVNGQERFERSGRFPQLGALCDARPPRLRRLHPRHAGLCRQRPDSHGGRAPLREAAAGARHAGTLGLLRRPGGAAAPEHLGVQAWNALRALDFLASLARRGPGAPGRDGVQRRRNADPCSSAPGSASRGLISSGDGVDLDAGWLAPCENACYLRVGTGNVEFAGLFAPQAAGDDGRERLAEGDDDEGLSRTRQALRPAGG